MIGTESCTVKGVDYEQERLTLSSPLSNSHPAGTDVTVVNFLIQAMGRRTDGSEPGSWDATAEYYDTLTYTHELPASQWDDWIRKRDDYSDPLGTLEFINTWRIASWIEEQV